MNILLSNDDGISANGIKYLAAALNEVADVYVVAPHTERSASGHSISLHDALKLNEVRFAGAVRAFEINGTPADCVKLGLKFLEQENVPIDMVFSGINHGGNLGTDTLYSGTVSAAIEGALCGVPGVAVSVNSRNPKHFEPACRMAVRCAKNAYGKLDKTKVLNVNFPDLPEPELAGVKITRLGVREYDDWFEKVINADGESEYIYGGSPKYYYSEDSDIDIIAVQDGYASITPLHFDLTCHDMLDEIKEWELY